MSYKHKNNICLIRSESTKHHHNLFYHYKFKFVYVKIVVMRILQKH
jgi:hypothetical protein